MAEDSKTDSWYVTHYSSKDKESKFILSQKLQIQLSSDP